MTGESEPDRTEAGISEVLRRPMASAELAAALADCLRSSGYGCNTIIGN
jgi:hypothetical protein